MGTRIPILVPFRSDGAARETNWDYIRACVWDPLPWAEVFVGESPDGPFNTSAARNHAASQAGDWDVAVFADADSFVNPDLIQTAIQIARERDQVVLPHSRWVNVREGERHTLLTEGWLNFDSKRTVHGGTKGSLYVIPRAAFEAVNGFDERFRGWGWEDTAFYTAVTTLHRPIIQFEGNLWHLDHERPNADINRGTDENAIANRMHFQHYKRARTATELRKLISVNRVKL